MISNLKKSYFSKWVETNHQLAIAFPRKLLNLLGVFFGCSRFPRDWFLGVVRGTQLWGLFAVTLSNISRMEGIGFTKRWNGTPWLTSHANWNPWTHFEMEKSWRMLKFSSMQGTLFLYSSPVRLLLLHPDRIVKIRTSSATAVAMQSCRCDCTVQGLQTREKGRRDFAAILFRWWFEANLSLSCFAFEFS